MLRHVFRLLFTCLLSTQAILATPIYRLESQQFSNNGRLLAYVDGAGLQVMDVETLAQRCVASPELLLLGDEELSEAELARCERQRVDPRSISEFAWNHNGTQLAFLLAGRVYIYDVPSDTLDRPERLPVGSHDVQFSPKGRYLSLVHDNNLYVYASDCYDLVWYTLSNCDTLCYGDADFCAQEELQRFSGYAWSPDDEHLAFTAVDSSTIPESVRVEVHGDGARIIQDRYPFAGGPNCAWSLMLLDLQTQSVDELLGLEQRGYLARLSWDRDGTGLCVQYLDRPQSSLCLYLYDLPSHKRSMPVSDYNDCWVNVHDDLLWHPDNQRFVWTSERSGYRHIYLGHREHGLYSQLTFGEWPVERVVGISDTDVYFEARKDPREKQLFVVPIAGGEPRRLTAEEGVHDICMAPDCSRYVDSYSSLTQAARVMLCDSRGLTAREISRVDAPATAHRVRFGVLEAPEGHELYYRIFLPPNFDPKKRYPAVIDVYGGPGVQRVQKVFHGATARYCRTLADQGYVIFTLDNRGTPGRGVEFERAIYMQLGQLEVDDQLVGLDFLRDLSYVDPNRVGVIGWSYGGYMALLLGLQAQLPAVSINPVTDWKSYDTAYTERYLSTPLINPDGYEQGSVMSYADLLDQPLLLIAGQADDNVFYFQNTMQLLGEFARLDKLVEERHYPGQRHGIRDYYGNVVTTLCNFFERHL